MDSMFYIKNAKGFDLPGIIKIEKDTYPSPWDEKAFKCELSKAQSGAGIFLITKTREEDIAGYAAGDFIVDYLHITNMAVKKEYRKRGIGGEFLRKLESETVKKGFSSITLEVNEKNSGAINLYKKNGFYEKGRRKNLYEGKYDGIIMWKGL